jgi:hypothetical protein
MRKGYAAAGTGKGGGVETIRRSLDEYVFRHHREHGPRGVVVSVAIAGGSARR